MNRRSFVETMLLAGAGGSVAAGGPGEPSPTLMLDAQSVAETQGVTFHLNPATPHPDNPVLSPGEPHQWDSLQVTWPATVLYDRRDRKFRCWYSGMDVIQVPGRKWMPGYAESEDGVHWRKPVLGQTRFLDRDTNQMKPDWATSVLSLVFENPVPANDGQRFGSYWIEIGPKLSYLRKGLAWSADGRLWKRERTAYEALPFNRPSLQDISQLIYDESEPDPAYRIKGYSQILRTRYDGKKNVRHIGLVHGSSVDQVADASDPVALAPEEGIDEELHFAAVRKVGSQFLMLYESDRFSRNPIHGDLRLAVSEDGRKFRRVHPRTPLVATGPRGTWNENLLVTTTSAMQEVGDQVYIFFMGCPGTYNSWPAEYAVSGDRRGSMFAPSFMGLATIDRDRFAYAQGPGTVVTKPLSFTQSGMWANCEGTDPEFTALDGSGKASGSGRVGSERRQSVYRKIVWEKGTPAGAQRVSCRLSAATKLYSLLA